MNASVKHGVGKTKQKERLQSKKILPVLTLGAVLLSASVTAAEEQVQFNIAPQTLSSALKEFAAKTDAQMLYASELVRDLSTKGVVGAYATGEALGLLLADTGITFKHNGDNAYILRRAAVAEDGSLSRESSSELPAMTVTATRTERDVTEVPASVTVISAEEIAQQHVIKPEDLLENVAGVDLIRQAGGLPGEITLRGLPRTFAGSTTQVLINGLPVEPIVVTNRMAWQLVAPHDIERIEIVKGPASALYGPNAAGGVINIITKRGDGKPYADISTGAGSHDAFQANVSSGGSSGPVDYWVGARRFSTDGFVAQPEPDAWGGVDLSNRGNADGNVSGRIGYNLSDDQELSAGYSYFDSDGDWLGGHPNYRWYRDGYLFDFSYRNRLTDVVDLKAKLLHADYNQHRTFDYDYWGDLGNLDVATKDWEDEQAQGAELQADFRLGASNTLTSGLSYNTGEWKFREEDVATGDMLTMSTKSRVLGVFLQDEQKVTDSLIVTVGGRYDRYKFFDDVRNGEAMPDSEDGVFNPRAGLRYKFTDNVSLYAAAGKAYLPALNILKFRVRGNEPGCRFCDNPDLKPERSTSYELGLNHTKIAGFINGRVALFNTDYTDKIDVACIATDSSGSCIQRQYQNLDAITVRGIEVGLDAAIGRHWYPFVNYTYTDAEIKESPSNPDIVGNMPVGVPKHKANIGFVYDNPALMTFRLAGRYVGTRYFDSENLPEYRTGGFSVLDAKVSKNFRLSGIVKNAQLSLAVNNILDKDYVEIVNSTTDGWEKADGRNFWVEVGAGF